MDSMVNHYTAHKRRRPDDAYTPGGAAGRRPDRAVIAYARLARQAFGPNTPIVLGGIEASLRRIAHYDYWDDRVHPSVLIPSGADLLGYGQGERPVLEIARRLASGEDICGLVDIPGTALALSDLGMAGLEVRSRGVVQLPPLEEVLVDKRRFAEAASTTSSTTPTTPASWCSGERLRHVVVNEPMPPPGGCRRRSCAGVIPPAGRWSRRRCGGRDGCARVSASAPTSGPLAYPDAG